MARFLSAEWMEQIQAAAGEDAGARPADAGVELTVRQIVSGGPDGDVRYTVRVAGGAVTVTPDGAGSDLEVTQDYATAVAISRGELTPSAAFAAGRIRLAGEIGLVVRHAGALAQLGDVFAAVRESTEY